MKSAIDQAAEALRKIVAGDKRERLRTIEFDPAGNTYEIEEVDGPWATIARAALVHLDTERAAILDWNQAQRPDGTWEVDDPTTPT